MRFCQFLAMTLVFAVCAASVSAQGGDVESRTRTMARTRTLGHTGRLAPGTYEGVGKGSTRQQALSSSCYSRSGMRVVSQSVRRGSDGMFYATRVYRP
jgi:hypothetical protein